MKIRTRRAELFHVDGQIDMTKLTNSQLFAILQERLKIKLTQSVNFEHSHHDGMALRGIRLQPQCKWGQRSSGISHSVEW